MISDFSHKISLGQNFLINPEVIRRCVEAGAIAPSDVLLEIGPGQGVLTRELLKSPCALLHSVEIDHRLAPWLTPLQTDFPDRFRLTWSDVMKLDLSALSPRPTKVLANIPYNITSDVIWKIVGELVPAGLDRMILLIQREAAERLAAPPGTRQRYPLGVTLEVLSSIRTVMKVSPGSFSPPPKVWSSLISIHFERNRSLAANPLWRRLLFSAFRQRRKKMIGNLAGEGWDRQALIELFDSLGIQETARAEELTMPQWLSLYASLQGRS